ncbi:hypothetical protein AB4084_16495, partial [Lysobacter sp. 2RAB21]
VAGSRKTKRPTREVGAAIAPMPGWVSFAQCDDANVIASVEQASSPDARWLRTGTVSPERTQAST